MEFFESSVEASLFDNTITEKALVPYLQTLIEDRELDLVATFGAPAAQFVRRHRELFSPATPKLYAALDARFLKSVSLEAREVAVPFQIDLSLLAGNIFQTLPNTKHFFLIFGKDLTGKFWTEAWGRELNSLRGRVSFEFWNELSFLQMRERAPKLPPNSAIVFGVLGTDAAGIIYDRSQAIRALNAVTNSPVFGVFDTDLDCGVVGGRLVMIREVARAAAEAGNAILRGEPVRKMNLVPTMGKPVYDWRELEHWQIPRIRLPAGSELLHRKPSIWELYKLQSLAVSAFLVLQTMLVLGLLWNRRLLRLAQVELAENQTRLQMATESAGAGLWSMELFPRRVWVTPKIRELFSFAADRELQYEDFFEPICSEDREMVRQKVEQALQGESPLVVEYRVLRSDGSIRWIASRGELRSNVNGKPGHLAGAPPPF